MRNATRWLGAEPVVPVRRYSRVEDALRLGRGFVAEGAKRIMRLLRRRWGIERLFGRAKEWLLLDGLRVRGLTQASIHVSLSLVSMLVVAVSAMGLGRPDLVRRVKRFTV